MDALVQWGAPLVGIGQGGDAFRTHWLNVALPAFFDGVAVADLAPLTVVVNTGDEPATIEVSGDGFAVHTNAAPREGAVQVEGEPEGVLALLTGTAGTKTPAGVSIRGPRDAVRRLHTLITRSRIATRTTSARNRPDNRGPTSHHRRSEPSSVTR